MFDCAAKTLATEGIGGFYKGFVPCILRAFPANAATFFAFEVTMDLIGRD
jgi:solute carrier family 25 carnitine/acylcarnitine transporter 20/29